MIQGKTQDGKRLSDIVSTILKLPNIEAREGNRHPVVLKYNGEPRYGSPGLCAIATSTSYTRHIIPWLKKITGYDKSTINFAMQTGYWN